MQVHRQHAEPWSVTLIDTGEYTQTGGRLKRIAGYVDDTFVLLMEMALVTLISLL